LLLLCQRGRTHQRFHNKFNSVKKRIISCTVATEMNGLCFSRLQSDPINYLKIQSDPIPTKLVKLKSEVRQNPTNFLFHSRLIINLPSLLQQICCKLNCFDLAYLLILAKSSVPRPSLTTDYFNCLTKRKQSAVQANLVIACIVLSTDNSSHFVFFCFRMSPIENRLPVDVTSLAKFL